MTCPEAVQLLREVLAIAGMVGVGWGYWLAIKYGP